MIATHHFGLESSLHHRGATVIHKGICPKTPWSCSTSFICVFFVFFRGLRDVTPSRFSEGLWLHARGFSRLLFLWKRTPFKKCYISRQGTVANLGHFICLFLLQVFSGLSIRIILNDLPHWVCAAAGVQFHSSFIVAHQLNKFISFFFGHHKTLMVYILDFWIDYQNSYKKVHHAALNWIQNSFLVNKSNS